MRKRLSKISIAKIIFTVLGAFCLGLTGCIPVKNISIDELQSREGIMLIIGSSNEGPIDWNDNDRVTGSSYNIYWDGVMTKKTLYSDSSEENGTAKLSDEDFEALYNFAKKNFENNTFEKYYEDWSDDGYAGYVSV